MRGLLGRLLGRLLAEAVEQVCRLADDQVCAMANLTDEADFPEP